MTIRYLLETLFEQLNAENIRYCVLRNYEGLPDSIGNDVDLLIEPGKLERFHECMMRSIISSGSRLVKHPSRFHMHSYWFELNDGGSITYTHIDVAESLHWRGICYISNDFFLNNRRSFGQFYIPDFAAETGLMFIKEIISGSPIKDKYKNQISECVEHRMSELSDFLRWGLGTKIADVLIKRATSKQWAEITTMSRRIRLSIFKHAFLRNPVDSTISFLKYLWGHLYSAFKRPSGFFLVLIGPDGSGKSTTARKLETSLKGLFTYQRYYHGRFGFLPEMKVFRDFMIKLSGRRRSSEGDKGSTSNDSHSPHGIIRMLSYVFYYSFDYFLGHFVVQRFQSIGGLIIADRYFYDWFIQAYHSKTPRWFFPVLKLVLPRPDLVVYLENRPEIIHSRKPELTLEQLEYQGRRCREIISNLPYSLTLSTESTANEVVSKISHQITKIMLERVR